MKRRTVVLLGKLLEAALVALRCFAETLASFGLAEYYPPGLDVAAPPES